MSHKSTPIIKTNRLILRGKLKKDASAMLKYYTDENVRGWLGGFPPTDIAPIKRMVSHDKSRSSWLIIEKQSGEIIGEFDIYRIVQGRLAEIGYILLSQHWGKGYMTEIMTAMLPYAFDRMKLDILRLTIMQENQRSRRLAEKMGFKLDAQINNADYGGRIENICIYSLHRIDYKARLEGSLDEKEK